jgi:hypothetical protein
MLAIFIVDPHEEDQLTVADADRGMIPRSDQAARTL